MMCILFCLLLLPALASAQETVSISELKATAPERWICEIQTEQRGTVTIDAPVHIPDVDAVPLLMVSEAPFIYELAGDESFLIGKADVRKREEILDPDRFSEIGYPPEDLLDFMQEKLSSHSVTDVELVLYRATALGSMYYVKQGKTYNKKYSFPSSNQKKTLRSAYFKPLSSVFLLRLSVVDRSLRKQKANNCFLLFSQLQFACVRNFILLEFHYGKQNSSFTNYYDLDILESVAQPAIGSRSTNLLPIPCSRYHRCSIPGPVQLRESRSAPHTA